MINITTLEDIKNLNHYIVIVPPKYEVYYKKMFLKEDVKLLTLNNFILNCYDGNKRLASKEENFIIMYQSLKNVKKELNFYKEVLSNDFINELINTYDNYKNYELEFSDKYGDLSIIYSCYEELLDKNGLINEILLYEYVVNHALFDEKYLFLNLCDMDDKVIPIINIMKNKSEVLLYLGNENKNIINKLNNIGCEILPVKNNYDDKKIGYKILNDVSDEVEFVSNDIAKKIIEGARYKDFIIVSNKISDYYPYFNTLLNHPFTQKNKTGILTNRFINLFCEILNGNFSCKNFISLLKLGLLDKNLQMIDKIDDYVYSWDIGKNDFYKPFSFNPNGDKKVLSQNDEIELKKINDFKDNIIAPIKYLLENVIYEKSKTEILKMLYTYLSEEGILDKLFEMDYEGALKLINVLDYLNDYLSYDINLIEIVNLLNGIDFSSSKSNENQDEITISSLKEALYEDKKFVYILGAVNENIPQKFSINGLLKENDLKKNFLIELLTIHENDENYLFKKALQCENVIITNHKLGLDLKLKLPSYYLKSLNLKEILCDKLYDKNLIINNYALSLSNDTINPSSLTEFKKINESNSHNLNYKISKQTVSNLYGDTINLSPSAIETYAKCPFQYFCKNSLKLKEKEKFTFDSKNIGTFVHYILENIMKNDMDNITLENLNDIILKYSESYLKESNKPVNNITKYVIKKLSHNIFLVIKNIIEEKNLSCFKPKYFEFKIDEKNLIKPIKINLKDGSVVISGIADRIDVLETKEKYYYRIIDYKTGDKKFRLDDILMGLNLQMLLYLLAIRESKENLTNKELVPSGILYYPALVKESISTRNVDTKEKEKIVKEKLKMNGLINKDKDVINIFGDELVGEFVSVTTRGKINEECLFGLEDLENIFNKIKNILEEFSQEIKNGNIIANPIGGRINSCAYCKFKSICKFDFKNDKKRKCLNFKNSEVLNMIEGDYNA